MSDKDLSNLPILDDIITPGEADKAAHDASSRKQSSLMQDQDHDTMHVSPANAVTVGDAVLTEDGALVTTESTAADQPEDLSQDQREMPSFAALRQEAPPEAAATDAAAEQPGKQQTHADIPNIDTLAKQILGSLMPDLEQLIRERIRQTLQQQPQNKPGSD